MLSEEEMKAYEAKKKEIRAKMEPIVDKIITDVIKSYPSDELFSDMFRVETAEKCIDKLMEEFSLTYEQVYYYDRTEMYERFSEIDQVINKEKWDKAREEAKKTRRNFEDFYT